MIEQRFAEQELALWCIQHPDDAAAEIERLRSDIERHVKIASDLATENEALHGQLVKARDRNKIMAALYDNIKSGFNGFYGVPEAADAIIALFDEQRSDPTFGYCTCGRHRDNQCDACVALTSAQRGGE